MRDRNQKRSFDSFTVNCDECGKECRVPFKPTAGKPVYCDACFRKQPRSNDRNDRGGRSDSRGFGGPRRDVGSGGRSFSKTDTKVYDELVKLNQKIDNLVAVLTPKAKAKKSSKEE